MKCDQKTYVGNYEFGHTVLSYLNLTEMFTKLALVSNWVDTLAYCYMAKITSVKSFIVQARDKSYADIA